MIPTVLWRYEHCSTSGGIYIRIPEDISTVHRASATPKKCIPGTFYDPLGITVLCFFFFFLSLFLALSLVLNFFSQTKLVRIALYKLTRIDNIDTIELEQISWFLVYFVTIVFHINIIFSGSFPSLSPFLKMHLRDLCLIAITEKNRSICVIKPEINVLYLSNCHLN